MSCVPPVPVFRVLGRPGVADECLTDVLLVNPFNKTADGNQVEAFYDEVTLGAAGGQLRVDGAELDGTGDGRAGGLGVDQPGARLPTAWTSSGYCCGDDTLASYQYPPLTSSLLPFAWPGDESPA